MFPRKLITNWDDVNSYLEIPGAPGDKVGFDLERRDWVAPYGKGVVADFLVSGRIQTEGLPKDIRRRHELTLYFPISQTRRMALIERRYQRKVICKRPTGPTLMPPMRRNFTFGVKRELPRMPECP